MEVRFGNILLIPFLSLLIEEKLLSSSKGWFGLVFIFPLYLSSSTMILQIHFDVSEIYSNLIYGVNYISGYPQVLC